MEKTINLSIIFFVIFILLVFVAGIFVGYINHKEPTKTLSEDLKVPEEIDKLTFIMQRFAKSHVYSNTESNKYNCLNYSREFYNVVTALGYKASIEKGCNYDINISYAFATNDNGSIIEWRTCHAWIRMTFDIEPIDGNFAVDYDKKYKYERVSNYKGD